LVSAALCHGQRASGLDWWCDSHTSSKQAQVGLTPSRANSTIACFADEVRDTLKGRNAVALSVADDMASEVLPALAAANPDVRVQLMDDLAVEVGGVMQTGNSAGIRSCACLLCHAPQCPIEWGP
jgi:hypothetical protein